MNCFKASSQSSQKQQPDYDDSTAFCGWFRSKKLNKSNMDQSRKHSAAKNRSSIVKSSMGASNCHYGNSQIVQINSTNSDSQRKNSETSPLVSSFIVQTTDSKYPLNQLFLLKNEQSGEQIFAKITETKLVSKQRFTIDVTKSLIVDQFVNDGKNVEQLTNNLISKQIATKIKEKKINSLAEFGCGNGCNTVQFANHLDFVIAIDSDLESCQNTRRLCNQNQYSNPDCPHPKVEIINADIFKFQKRLIFETIFIHPLITYEQDGVKDIIKECSPNLQKLLKQICDKIENVIIQLPANIDFSQLPLLLNIDQQYKNNNSKKQQSLIAHCSLEIEKIYHNGIHVQNVIYYGRIANIQPEELRKILTLSLQNNEVKQEAINNVIGKLKEKIGSIEVVYELLYAQSYKQNIDQFLNHVCQKYKLDYTEFGFILYKKLSKDYSQNTFTQKFRDTNQEYNESNAVSPQFQFAYNLDDEIGQQEEFGITFDENQLNK